MEPTTIRQDSPAWVFFVHVSFALALGLMGLGIYLLPVSLWIKGYFAMGLFFTVGSTLTLSKTLRDQHENKKLVNRLSSEGKAENLLHEFERTP